MWTGAGNGEKNSKKRLKLGMKLQKLVAKRPFQRPSVLLTSFMRNIQRKKKGISERISVWPTRFILRSFADMHLFREQEEEYITSLTEKLSAGTTWERICDLLELENSQSKTIARSGPGATDLTRFKEVLLRLKRDGDRAPGAAGY